MRSDASALRGGANDRLGSSALPVPVVMAGMLFVALVVRLLFINADGFKNDVSTFEAWSLTLADYSTRQFFAKAGFADYPPGYFFVLWIVGHLYRLLVHSDPTYGLLKIAVKLPAIVCDLADSLLIFAIVRRFAPLAWAFGAAAFFAFDPAAIFISAYWGQVDSVAGLFTLLALYALLVADGRTGRAATFYVACGWLALGYSILIKPPAIVLAPLFLAYAFASSERARRIERYAGTYLGIAAALVLAYLAALVFHAGVNPIDQFAWLYGRYKYASSVYPYNSVNAFNLYVIGANHFWQSDAVLVPNWTIGGRVVGLPQYLWGIALSLVAVALVVSRYVQRREIVALFEAAMILSLGYFVLSTRMHERYDFNALMLAVPLIFYRRRYALAALLLSLTMLGNLYYSLDYLRTMTDHTPGADATDLIPWLSRPLSLLNVATFFYLGYAYLGNGSDALEKLKLSRIEGAVLAVRGWFAPLEGVAWMRPVDWAIASALSVASFVLTFAWYWYPSEKIFDEIYYARAGEEYLKHVEIFEFTHPPLTKLWVTLSMMLFGGLHGLGDTAWGWRFGDLVMGALMVLLMYCFAKRIFGSTAFATIAAGLLLFDGFHFVQSRIATPEITVAFFTLLTLYAFYRFWIAAQVRVASVVDRRGAGTQAVAIAILLAVAALGAWFLVRGQSTAAHVVVFLYLGCGAYALVRSIAPRLLRARPLVSYADGSRIEGNALVTFDGGSIPLGRGSAVAGLATVPAGTNGLAYRGPDFSIEYAADGTATYATPDGVATYAPEGEMRAGTQTFVARNEGPLWFAILTVSAACLGASKWNGLFDFFVVWLLVLVVCSQRYWAPIARAIGFSNVVPRPAALGNPLGFSFDVVVTAMLFIGGTVYTLCYIPYFTLGHNIADMISLQQQMFIYHDQTVAHATHPYSSRWWQWPILEIPISYYYHDFRTGAALQNGAACCVAEVMALPNPISWWLGLASVPFMGYIAWREKNKAYKLLFVAYFIQWLPWILSPRISFEYHFLPNLALILMADTLLLQRLWFLQPLSSYARGDGSARWRLFKSFFGAARTEGSPRSRWAWNQYAVAGVLVAVVGGFVFWYPVVAGTHLSYDAWSARMLTGLEGNNWINPHPGK